MDSSKTDPKIITLEQAKLLSDEEKKIYFFNVRIKHLKIDLVFDEMQDKVSPGSGTDIALLIGPTGVGKSAFTKYLKTRLISQYADKMKEDQSMIPVVLLSAPAAGDKSFSWRMFYIQLGKELKEPLLDKKQEDRLQDGRRSLCHISSGGTVTGLRLAIEDAIKLRKTVLVIIDEAIHFIRQAKWISKTNGLNSQMDALKSLTIMDDVSLTIAFVTDNLKLYLLRRREQGLLPGLSFSS